MSYLVRAAGQTQWYSKLRETLRFCSCTNSSLEFIITTTKNNLFFNLLIRLLKYIKCLVNGHRLLVENVAPEYSYRKTNFIIGLTRVKRICEVIFQTWGFVPTILLLPVYKTSYDVPIVRRWDSDLNPHFVNCVLCSVHIRIHE